MKADDTAKFTDQNTQLIVHVPFPPCTGGIYDQTSSYNISFCVIGVIDVICGFLITAPLIAKCCRRWRQRGRERVPSIEVPVWRARSEPQNPQRSGWDHLLPVLESIGFHLGALIPGTYKRIILHLAYIIIHYCILWLCSVHMGRMKTSWVIFCKTTVGIKTTGGRKQKPHSSSDVKVPQQSFK